MMDSSLTGGVYTITCRINGKVYVGSSQHAGNRIKAHFRALLAGKHHCHPLQSDYGRYGRDAFAVQVFQFPGTKLRKEESQGIAYYRKLGLCYNIGNIVSTGKRKLAIELTREMVLDYRRWNGLAVVSRFH